MFDKRRILSPYLNSFNKCNKTRSSIYYMFNIKHWLSGDTGARVNNVFKTIPLSHDNLSFSSVRRAESSKCHIGTDFNKRHCRQQLFQCTCISFI